MLIRTTQPLGTPNKERRVLAVTRAAMRRPGNARKLVEHLLVSIRVGGYLQDRGAEFASKVRALQGALRRAGWQLSDDGVLSPLGVIDLTTGGRPALDEQIDRLRRSADDAGALLGSAKDMLEATAKLVLEELGLEVSKKADFNYLWHLLASGWVCIRLRLMHPRLAARRSAKSCSHLG
jgi:hypothetical protein